MPPKSWTKYYFRDADKLNNAQTLLESTNYTIKEISNLVGYDVAVYFDKLTPLLEEYLEKKKNLTPEEFDEYKNTFPDSSEVSQDILKSLDE